MSNRSRFFDTNVLIYAVGSTPLKSPIALALLESTGTISTHVLGEFTNVCRSKLRWSWRDIDRAIERFLNLCPDPLPIDLALHHEARRTAEKLGYSIFDATVIAAALRAGCETLLSEDMQHGQVIDGRLTISNPFL